MKQLSKSVLVSIFLSLLSFIYLPQTTEAVVIQAVDIPDTIQLSSNVDYKGLPNEFVVFGFTGLVSISNFEKEINLVNNGSFLQTNFVNTLSIGESISLLTSPTRGSYFLTGGLSDSPPFDGVSYQFANGYYSLGSVPNDGFSQISLISNNQNIIKCEGLNCLLVGSGTADVQVVFNNTNQPIPIADEPSGVKVSGVYDKDRDGHGFTNLQLGSYDPSNIYFTYEYPSVTYTITVQQGNSAPNVQYQNTSNITMNSAISNWSYSDADGDAQTQWQVQIATEGGYNNIVVNQSGGGSQTSTNISGLQPGTTYYPRVRGYNNVNGWSGWSNGGAFTTVANQPANVVYQSTTNITGNSAVSNWSYSDAEGDVQTQWEIQVSTDSSYNGGQIIRGSGSQTSGNVSGLQPGTTYYPRVRGYNNVNGWSGWSNGGAFRTTPNPQMSFTVNGSSTPGPIDVYSTPTVPAVWGKTDPGNTLEANCSSGTLLQDRNGGWTINYPGLWTGYKASNGGTENLVIPINSSSSNITYKLQLYCPVKANTGVNATYNEVNITVVPTFAVQCSVITPTTSADILAKVRTTATNYSGAIRWELDEDKGGSIQSRVGVQGVEEWEIDYSEEGLSKKRPKIKVTEIRSRREANGSCGTIVNFGDRKFREVAP